MIPFKKWLVFKEDTQAEAQEVAEQALLRWLDTLPPRERSPVESALGNVEFGEALLSKLIEQATAMRARRGDRAAVEKLAGNVSKIIKDMPLQTKMAYYQAVSSQPSGQDTQPARPDISSRPRAMASADSLPTADDVKKWIGWLKEAEPHRSQDTEGSIKSFESITRRADGAISGLTDDELAKLKKQYEELKKTLLLADPNGFGRSSERLIKAGFLFLQSLRHQIAPRQVYLYKSARTHEWSWIYKP